MGRGTRVGKLAAPLCGVLLALPLAALAQKHELDADDRCSRADAETSAPAESAGPATPGRQDGGPEPSSESALTAEATRPLPAVAPAAPGAAQALPERFEARSARVAPERVADPADVTVPRRAEREAPPGSVEMLGFHDYRAPRERFRAIRELKLLHLWDTTRITVWFGLDRKGRPGVHFRQRNPGEELVAQAPEALVSPPPLRSVPLSAQ
jgi:hypothetical protein